MPNRFPIGPLAVLMFPPVHRSELEPQALASALDFARCFPEYLIFHNMEGSGASRPDHAHLQGLLRDDPYPIECAHRLPLFSIGETNVARLSQYPVYALAVGGPHVVEVVFSVRAEGQADNPKEPFNLVLTLDEVIVIPRNREHPAGFVGAFAGLEMAGGIVLTDAEQYSSSRPPPCGVLCRNVALTSGSRRPSNVGCGVVPLAENGRRRRPRRQDAPRLTGRARGAPRRARDRGPLRV
jgi:hypothetical protein